MHCSRTFDVMYNITCYYRKKPKSIGVANLSNARYRSVVIFLRTTEPPLQTSSRRHIIYTVHRVNGIPQPVATAIRLVTTYLAVRSNEAIQNAKWEMYRLARVDAVHIPIILNRYKNFCFLKKKKCFLLRQKKLKVIHIYYITVAHFIQLTL